MDGVFRPLDVGISEDPSWDSAKPRCPVKRASRGVRQPSNRSNAGATSNDDDGGWNGWEGLDGLGAAGDGDTGGSEQGAAVGAADCSSFSEQAGNARSAWAGPAAVVRQQKWDGIRPKMHRSYVENLAGMRAMFEAERQSQREALQHQLAQQQACCSCCGSTAMQLQQFALVLYISNENRFLLEVPLYACSETGCNGTYAPSSFVVGCFPATPKASWDVSESSAVHSARWLDLRMLQLADTLIFQGGRSIAVNNFAAAVHQQHQLNGCSMPLKLDHFKRQLGEAIMEYGYLMCALMVVANLGVHGLPHGPLSSCPCCAMARPLHSINIDFTFSLPHWLRCGTSAVQLLPHNEQLFLHGPEVAGLVRASGRDGAVPEPDRACSDFNAARVLARTSDKCDVTAVGSTMCRHSIVAHLLDINTGERYIYAAVMLYMLMVVYAIPILVVWYDINCKFGPYFLRWAAAQAALKAVLEHLPSRLCFPLPTFHRFSHSAACQEKNDGVYMTGTGQQYHEPNETFWSFIGPLGTSTQYMNHRNRWGRLERAGQLYNARAAARAVPLLCAMTAKAHNQLEAASSKTTDLIEQLKYQGIDTHEAAELMARRAVAAEGLLAQAGTSPMVEYAQLRLQQQYISNSATANLPAAANLFNDRALERLAPGSAAQRGMLNRLAQLERELFGGERPLLDSPAFAGAAGQLASSEISRLQASLTRLAQQCQLLDQLIPRLTARPGEQARLRRAKQALKARVEPELNSLLRWLGGGYVGFEQLPTSQRQHAAAAANADKWNADVICRGIYPWEHGSTSAGVPLATCNATRDQLITQLRMHGNEMARAEEELQLLKEERARCQAYWEHRQTAIKAAIEHTQQRLAAVEAGGQVPPCTSFAAQQPTGAVERVREQQYCAGMLLLLADHLEVASSQVVAATTAFAADDWAVGLGLAGDVYDVDSDEDDAGLN